MSFKRNSYRYKEKCYQEWIYHYNSKKQEKQPNDLRIPNSSLKVLDGMSWTISNSIDLLDVIAIGSYGVVASGEMKKSNKVMLNTNYPLRSRSNSSSSGDVSMQSVNSTSSSNEHDLFAESGEVKYLNDFNLYEKKYFEVNFNYYPTSRSQKEEDHKQKMMSCDDHNVKCDKKLLDFTFQPPTTGMIDFKPSSKSSSCSSSVHQKIDVCIKRSLDLNSESIVSKAFWLELILMKTCDHPNIVNLLDYYFDNDTCSLTLVMPRAQFDLQYGLRIPKMKQYHQFLLMDILESVDYLHSNKIVHRDLVPSNIFIYFNDNHDSACPWKACLGDLGMACVAFSTEQTHQMFCTFPYRAPELFCKQGTTNPAVDIWSLGCITAEMVQLTSLFYYPGEQVNPLDEWIIFGRQMCALVPKEQMSLRDQNWIHYNNNGAKSLFNDVKKQYISHDRLLWAFPKGYQCPEELFIRKLLVINPQLRPDIKQVCSYLNVKTHAHEYNTIHFNRQQFVKTNGRKNILPKIQKEASV